MLLDQSRDVHHLIPLTLACAALTALLADRILSALPREGSWTREGVTALYAGRDARALDLETAPPARPSPAVSPSRPG